MPFLADFFPESKFGGFSDADVTIAFYNRVNALIDESSIVVDFGCGRGVCLEDPVPYRRRLRLLKGKSKKVIGLDVDPRAVVNAALDEFLQIAPGSPWPIGDRSIDLILCDCVIEHLTDPAAFFSEAQRVLRPGCGIICIRTPNVWSYIGVISRLIPNAYHTSILQKAQENRPSADIFPTLYRCNTMQRMRKTMTAHGFDHVVYGAESDPGYLDFASFIYRLGVLHRKLAPGFLRPVIFAFGRLRPILPPRRPDRKHSRLLPVREKNSSDLKAFTGIDDAYAPPIFPEPYHRTDIETHTTARTKLSRTLVEWLSGVVP